MSDRWDRIVALFEAALEQPAEAREEWLDEACGDDPALRREVEQMLAADEQTDGILDRPIHGAFADAADDGGEEPAVEERQFGPYRLVEELGRGGMGVVYKARDPRLDRFVALKFLSSILRSSEEASTRFETEARAAAALDHPNICTIHDVGTVGEPEEESSIAGAAGQLFVAMAYYEGPTLEQKIEEGPLSVEQGLDLAIQVADGLACAHDAGIIHRDVKPSNLILTDRGTVKILDFGIAKLERAADHTEPGDRLGTVAYMAPEQVRGEAVDPRTDLWSLGVVLYELLTAQHPFGDGLEAALLHALLHDDPPSLQTVRPECPDALDDVLHTALAKDPAQRHASASDLIDDLKAVQGADSASAIPPPEAAPSSQGPLPAPLTSFVGREREVEAVTEQVSAARLVTLTGPAGTGKTRLAVQVASAMTAEMNDGVFFVPLAPVTDPDLVASAIARVLDVDEKPTQPIAESLKETLQNQHALLVLDNFEQVISAAPVVAELLAACPALHVLVTSREALRLSGEQEVPVPPLEVPPSDAALDPEALPQYSAVALFVERAQAIRPHFALSEENARPVAELCRRLEGLPLAIELAAARIKLFSPGEMLERLSHRLDLLKGGSRDRPARHQTLRQAIAWSYNLLDEQEQAFFRRMAVFVGGGTLEAAETVANAYEEIALDVVDGVAALVDRNLLRREDGPNGTSRYVMLETIRAYGLERLQAEGEKATTRQAHADYFLALAETAEPELTGPKQGHWLDRLDAEHDNLRAALSWTEETENTEMGLRIGAALWRFWAVRGHLREGCQRLQRLLDRPAAQPRTKARARALNAVGTLLHETSSFDEARTRLEESLSIWRDLGNESEMATTLNNLGWVALQTGGYDQAQAQSEEALSLCRQLGTDRDIALSLNNLGWVALYRGEFDTARSLYRESLDLRRELGEQRGTAFALTNLAWAERHRGEYERAESLLEEALDILHSLDDRQLIGWARNIQALVAYDQGAFERADTAASDSVSLFREVGNKEGIAYSLCTLADVTRARGDTERAKRSVDEAHSIAHEINDQWDLAWTVWIQGQIAYDEDNAAQALELYEESLSIWGELDAKWGVVVCLEAIARGRYAATPDEAVRLLSAADALRDRICAPRPPTAQDEYERLVAMLRETLDEEAFREVWTEGHAMEVRDAVAVGLRNS